MPQLFGFDGLYTVANWLGVRTEPPLMSEYLPVQMDLQEGESVSAQTTDRDQSAGCSCCSKFRSTAEAAVIGEYT